MNLQQIKMKFFKIFSFLVDLIETAFIFKINLGRILHFQNRNQGGKKVDIFFSFVGFLCSKEDKKKKKKRKKKLAHWTYQSDEVTLILNDTKEFQEFYRSIRKKMV